MKKREQEPVKCMSLKNFKLIRAFEVGEEYMVGIYEGMLSEYDILVKYRQKMKKGWSRIRTPKHIHWAVDVMMKMQGEKEKTKEFLNFLLDLWKKIEPIRNEKERLTRTDVNHILDKYKDELDKYKELSDKGEYSIEFLVLLAELLMIQEKTNMPGAYKFEKLLQALEKGEDIFGIVSIATHTGR